MPIEWKRGCPQVLKPSVCGTGYACRNRANMAPVTHTHSLCLACGNLPPEIEDTLRFSLSLTEFLSLSYALSLSDLLSLSYDLSLSHIRTHTLSLFLARRASATHSASRPRARTPAGASPAGSLGSSSSPRRWTLELVLKNGPDGMSGWESFFWDTHTHTSFLTHTSRLVRECWCVSTGHVSQVGRHCTRFREGHP